VTEGFLLFYMCQLWALHVSIKRQFFFLNVYCDLLVSSRSVLTNWLQTTNLIWVASVKIIHSYHYVHLSFQFLILLLFLSTLVLTARRSYASAVLGVVILSVCQCVRPSVCHTRALWLIERTFRRYFIPHERAVLLVFWGQISRRNSNGANTNGGAK